MCLRIAGFWCCVNLLTLAAISYLLLSDVDILLYQTMAYVLEYLFMESFICGAAIWCYGMDYDIHHDETEQKAIS